MLSTGTERCGEKSAKEQSCTPEKQKASHSSGEPLMERTVMHPRKAKNKSFQWCKEMPPQLYCGGRTPPAIKLLTNVNKAGSCCHREIRRCTPEKGKTSHYRGARKRPPHIRSSAGRRESSCYPTFNPSSRCIFVVTVVVISQ